MCVVGEKMHVGLDYVLVEGCMQVMCVGRGMHVGYVCGWRGACGLYVCIGVQVGCVLCVVCVYRGTSGLCVVCV